MPVKKPRIESGYKELQDLKRHRPFRVPARVGCAREEHNWGVQREVSRHAGLAGT